MYFLGYVDGEFGYRWWDPVKSKVIRSRDVIFNELEMFKKPICDMKVKKLTDWFVEQEENIRALQENNGQQAENGGQPAEDDGQAAENYGQREVEALQQPLQEIQPENIPPQSVHRSTRPHKPSQRYSPSNYILLIDEGEPHYFQEAL